MKKILLLFSFICSLPIYADHYLVIELNNSKKHSYSLEEKPVISFNNDKLVIETDNIKLDYLIDDIAKYYFSEAAETDVEDIKYDVNNIHFTYTNPDFLLIEGVTGNENVLVYEINGRTCPVDILKSDNCIKVQLNTLPNGLYIINVDNKHSFKIIRK